jgi:hypothetical protein
MARFKRLTDAEARTLTRAELLDRIEAEQQYWFRKLDRPHTDADREAWREFVRIMHRYLPLDKILDELLAVVEGRAAPGYWERRPCDDPETADGD